MPVNWNDEPMLAAAKHVQVLGTDVFVLADGRVYAQEYWREDEYGALHVYGPSADGSAEPYGMLYESIDRFIQAEGDMLLQRIADDLRIAVPKKVVS